MNVFGNLNLDPQYSVRLTWVLAHFLWQGTAVALIGVGLCRLLRRQSAHLRYLALVSSLAIMVASPAATWYLLSAAGSDSPLADSGPAPPPADAAFEPSGEEAGKTSGPPEIEIVTPVRPPSEVPEPAIPAEPATGPQPIPTAAVSPRWSLSDFAPVLAGLYLAGVGVMLLRLLMSITGGWRLRRRLTPVSDPSVIELVARQAQQIGLKAAPLLGCCKEVSVPMVIGILRPLILLPPSLITGMRMEQIGSLLSHELAHIRRYDLLVNILQRTIEALLFFHPGVWVISRRINVEREHCCDDDVLGLGWKPTGYAESLVRMAELCLKSQSEAHSLAGLAVSGQRPSELRARVARLLGAKMQTSRRIEWTGLWCTLGIVLTVLITPAIWTAEPAAKPLEVTTGPETEKKAAPVATEKTAARGKSLIGHILDKNSRLVPGATVEIFSTVPNVKQIGVTTTDSFGRFEFKQVKEDWITVMAKASSSNAGGKGGKAIQSVSEPQRADLRRGNAYLRLHMPVSLVKKESAVYLTSGSESDVGIWTEKATTPVRGFRFIGTKAKKRRGWQWGPLSSGLEAALQLKPADNVPLDKVKAYQPTIIIHNVTDRLLFFRLFRRDFPGDDSAIVLTDQANRKHRHKFTGLDIDPGKKNVPADKIYEILLRPGDEFALPLARVRLSDLKNFQGPLKSATATLLIHSDHGDGPRADQHVPLSIIQTGISVPPGGKPAGGKNKSARVRVRGRVVDALTGKPIKNFRSVPTSFSKYHEKSKYQPTWQSHLLAQHRNGNLDWSSKGYPRTRMRIEAAGYLPAISRTFMLGNTWLDLELMPQPPIEGKIVDTAGKPLAGIDVAIGSMTKTLKVDAGKLKAWGHAERLGKTVTTDKRGVFRLPPEVDDWWIVACHPDRGYAEVIDRDFARSKTLTLQPWAQVSGRIVDADGKPVVGRDVSVYSSRPLASAATTEIRVRDKTDAQGRFSFQKVAPGRVLVQRFLAQPVTGTHIDITLKGGQTTRLDVGAIGRSVLGQLKPQDPAQTVDWSKYRLTLRLPAVRNRGFGRGVPRPAGKPFASTAEGRHYHKAGIPIDKNGRFRIEGLPAAAYEMWLTQANPQKSVYRHRHMPVPPVLLGEKNEPHDAGMISVRIPGANQK